MRDLGGPGSKQELWKLLVVDPFCVEFARQRGQKGSFAGSLYETPNTTPKIPTEVPIRIGSMPSRNNRMTLD
jgi:hypothetical protein